MGVLIDASILIEWERGGTPLEAHLAGREDEEFFVSVITASELLHGIHRAERASSRARRSAFVEGVLASFPLLEIDLPTARAHGQVWAELARAGTRIGAHDLWLAAACLAHGLTMVTSNAREFGRVPGLMVDDWSTRS